MGVLQIRIKSGNGLFAKKSHQLCTDMLCFRLQVCMYQAGVDESDRCCSDIHPSSKQPTHMDGHTIRGRGRSSPPESRLGGKKRKATESEGGEGGGRAPKAGRGPPLSFSILSFFQIQWAVLATCHARLTGSPGRPPSPPPSPGALCPVTMDTCVFRILCSCCAVRMQREHKEPRSGSWKHIALTKPKKKKRNKSKLP